MTQITDHLAKIRERVARAASAAGRDADSITIVAVSKKQSPSAVQEAFDAGQRDFGESFAQEGVAKITALSLPRAHWHFIGHVQANKTKDIARHFDWVHTIDRPKIGHRLNEQRPHYASPINVCIQVNLAEEPQKRGISAEEIPALAAELRSLPRLRLRGLMTIPPADAAPAAIAELFGALRDLQSDLIAEGYELDTLSMGMSADLEIAIRCGSTLVRVGTAIFGPRD